MGVIQNQYTSVLTSFASKIYNLFSNKPVGFTPATITLTNPQSRLVFYSLSGTLYTDNAGANPCALNTVYTGTTFYYNSNQTKPTGNYLYDFGNGYPTQGGNEWCKAVEGPDWTPTYGSSTFDYNAIKLRWNDGSLTALYNGYEPSKYYAWTTEITGGGSGSVEFFAAILMSSGKKDSIGATSTLYRCVPKSF